MNFSLTTLGCKVNQYDSCAVAAELQRAGLTPAAPGEPVDLVVINTCCVTTVAMRKSRQAIRRACRDHPSAVILVIGCYADYDPDRIHRALSSLDVPPSRIVIAGHHDDTAARIEQIVGILQHGHQVHPQRPIAAGPGPQPSPSRSAAYRPAGPIRRPVSTSDYSIRTRRADVVKGNVPGTQRLGPIRRFSGHSRAFVKVQDGCDAFCAFCIVPYLRCRVWSRPVDQALAECRQLVASGHKEIVLCGVCLGAYGRDTTIRRGKSDGAQLAELVARVGQIKGLWRLRLSSLNPYDLSDDLLSVCSGLPNFAAHLHLPLQSGSAAILRRMNRRYSPDEFRCAVDRARAVLDRPAITTDVIVGFPGESEDDFDATLSMVRDVGFAKVHIFPFSPIRGTAAWTYRREAPPRRVVRRRAARLAEVARAAARRYRQGLVGSVTEALVEHSNGDGSPAHRAMTPWYVPAWFSAAPRIEAGSVVRLRLEQASDEGFAARLEAIL